jgi:hypothetical protein
MMNDPGTPAQCRNNQTLIRFTGFFYGVLGAAVVLALMILLLSGKDYLALSNYLQILTAIAASCVFLYVWHRFGRREIHLVTAGAFGLWGISNIAWYVNILIGQRNGVFPSLIDIGMIAAIFLLALAFRQGLPQQPIAKPVLIGIAAIALLIPLGVIALAGISLSSLATLLYFIACGTLVVSGLVHAPKDDRYIPAGAILFALTFMIYPLREMFFITNPALSVIGTFVSAGIALITIGLLTRDIRGQAP